VPVVVDCWFGCACCAKGRCKIRHNSAEFLHFFHAARWALHAPARVNVTCVTPLDEEVASTS